MPQGFKMFRGPKQFKILVVLGGIFIVMGIACLFYGVETSTEVSDVFAGGVALVSASAVLLLSLSLFSIAFIKTQPETVEKYCEEANMPDSNPDHTTFLTKTDVESDINNAEDTQSFTVIEAYPDGTSTKSHREQIQTLYIENKITKEAMGRLIGMINLSELDDRAAARARSRQIRNVFENFSKIDGTKDSK